MEKDIILSQWEVALHFSHNAHTRSFSYYKYKDRIINLLSAMHLTFVAHTVNILLSELNIKTVKVITGQDSFLKVRKRQVLSIGQVLPDGTFRYYREFG